MVPVTFKPKSTISVTVLMIFMMLGLFHVLALGNEIVSNETCLDCHDDMQESLKNTPHQPSSIQKNRSSDIACVDCHSGAEIHIEDPDIDNISNPARLQGFEARQACSGCHKPHSSMDNYGFDVHSELQLNCSDCHQVHGGDKGLLLSTKAEFCLKCHEEMQNPFSRRSMHPVNQQTITCLSCHSFAKRKDMSTVYEFERVCQDCHPQQAGPFPFEHEAANAYAVEGNGCLSCHDPHGSENEKLLKQTGKELCMSCHMTPAGHMNLPALHGTLRDIENCVACHSAVHGSFTSHKLLDPLLQSRLGSPQNCNQCHDLSD